MCFDNERKYINQKVAFFVTFGTLLIVVRFLIAQSLGTVRPDITTSVKNETVIPTLRNITFQSVAASQTLETLNDTVTSAELETVVGDFRSGVGAVLLLIRISLDDVFDYLEENIVNGLADKLEALVPHISSLLGKVKNKYHQLLNTLVTIATLFCLHQV